MAATKILQWNSERGFGFVMTEQGRAFLHSSAIKTFPRVERGENLEGKEVVVLEMAQGPKGLRVVAAEVGIWDPRLVLVTGGVGCGSKLTSADSCGWSETWESNFRYISIGGQGFATLGTVLNPKGTGRWNALVERSSHITYLLDRVQTYEEAVLEYENRERSENGGWLIIELRDLINEICRSNPGKALTTPNGDSLRYYRKKVQEGMTSREDLAREISSDLEKSPDQPDWSSAPSSGWVIYNMRDEMQD